MDGSARSRSSAAGAGRACRSSTHAIPKALVEIGGKPILWHVIRIYAAQGLRRFLLLTGYLGEMIEEFVPTTEWPEPVEIECVDTGLDTPTGGRIARVARAARRRALLRSPTRTASPTSTWRRWSPSTADTATLGDDDGGPAATPNSGLADLDPTTIGCSAFEEKPRLDHWVNGGFFCFEPAFLDYLAADSVLEQRAPAPAWRPPGSCAPSGTRASGTAWTPTRTR